MQKLKKKPLLQRVENTVENLLASANKPLALLAVLPKPLVTIVLIALCLLFFSLLCGCSPRMVKPTLPPQAEPREMPVFAGKTNRDTVLYAIEVREWGLSCEADKAAIRKVYGHE